MANKYKNNKNGLFPLWASATLIETNKNLHPGPVMFEFSQFTGMDVTQR